MAGGAAAGGSMRKKYKTLPFESKKRPRGKLLCEARHLRIDPPGVGAMVPVQLQDICDGLAENEYVQALDLDGNMLQQGISDDSDDEDEPVCALAPLVQLVKTNNRIRKLDISNNSLSFDDSATLQAVRSLILESNLNKLFLGGETHPIFFMQTFLAPSLLCQPC